MADITTQEAKEKWCPFKDQLYLEQSHNIGVSTNSLPENNCIADKCIMWKTNPSDSNKGSCGLAK